MRQGVAIVTRAAVVRRRRREEGSEIQKASFTLHAHIVARMKAAVASGLARNASAFVEDAVQEKLRRIRRAALDAAYDEASRDPRFMADMDVVERDFESTIGDGLGDEPRG